MPFLRPFQSRGGGFRLLRLPGRQAQHAAPALPPPVHVQRVCDPRGGARIGAVPPLQSVHPGAGDGHLLVSDTSVGLLMLLCAQKTHGSLRLRL